MSPMNSRSDGPGVDAASAAGGETSGECARGPLAGVRVLDATVYMVGPWATMLLGAMGAEVLHVEQPDVDWSQLSAMVPPMINGTSIGYLAWNANKRGLFLDLKGDEDRHFARELVKTCDVVVVNFRPGVAERLGLGYEELAAINPRLIYCSATGHGLHGPRADDRAADPQVQALTGFWTLNGARGEPAESYRHFTQLDGITGNTLAEAVLMALYARRRTGRGQRIDLTMLDSSATLQTTRFAESLVGAEHPTLGSSSHATAPDRAFRCADARWIGVSVTSEDEWQGFCAALDRHDLATDPRFGRNRDRVARRAELEAILVPVLAARPLTYWELAFTESRVPFGTPLTWETLRYHEQVLANGYLQEIETPAWGTHWAGGPPWRFSRTPARMTAAPIPGDATYELLEEVAGGADDV